MLYTGTHDNPTTREWFGALPDRERRDIWNYLRRAEGDTRDATPELIRLAWSSPAALAITSLQDLLNIGREGTDERARPRERELALARDAAHVIGEQLPVAAGIDRTLRTVSGRRSAAYEGRNMKATQLLSNLGQSIWVDNITRDLLDTGTLQNYIDKFSVTGLTANPTIFENAIKGSPSYDAQIRAELGKGRLGEEIFFDLALDDITRAADLFRPIHDRTNTVDGWVSLEVSPLLAHDADSTFRAAADLFARARRPNLFIKIPGTREGLPAIEEAIFAGIPVNVTLLFSREQYLAAADAFLRGIERRMQAGLNPNVGSVASVFVSRWDAAVKGQVPAALSNKLGIAIAKRTYNAARDSAGIAAVAADLQRRVPPPAPLMGKYRDKGPVGLRHFVRQGAGRSQHG